MEGQEIETVKLIPNGHIPGEQRAFVNGSKTAEHDDINHTRIKSRIAFLDIRNDSPNKLSPESPDKSPLVDKHPFVPPLDFSTLHEHVGTQGILQYTCWIDVF